MSTPCKLQIIEEARIMARSCVSSGHPMIATLLMDLVQVVEARGRRIRDLTAELRKYQRSAPREVKPIRNPFKDVTLG